jgi:hypothetical protein
MPPAQSRAGRLPTVSVVIPALDEAGNIALVLEGLPPLVDEVIVVDGGSADDTVAVARQARPGVQVVRQNRFGKGNALACGFALCRGDIVVTLNGDGSTDPGEIPRFVDALLAGAEVAHGSRFRTGGGDVAGTALSRFGDRLLSRMVNRFFGTRFTDVGSGYNAFWRAPLDALGLPAAEPPGRRGSRPVWGEGAEIEPLVNIRRPSAPAKHDASTAAAPARAPHSRRADTLRPAAPQPYVVGERATGRHAIRNEATPRRPYPGPRPDWADSVDRRSVRRSGVYSSDAHDADPATSGVRIFDPGVRHSGLYDTGVRRTGVYDAGVHRMDVYETGAQEPAREVGGGRRRLDAKDRRAVPGERGTR